jgi:hypothetical protein
MSRPVAQDGLPVLISDCCHSGTIWDIPDNPDKFPKGVIRISAALDDQTAKQTEMEKSDHGLFSYYFWKFWREDRQISPTAIAAKMQPFLVRYSQEVVISVTSPGLVKPAHFPKATRQGPSKPSPSNLCKVVRLRCF